LAFKHLYLAQFTYGLLRLTSLACLLLILL